MPSYVGIPTTNVNNVLDIAAPEPHLRSMTTGPNDLFEISSNNSPDPPDDDEETHEPQDYAGEYPLEGDDGEDE